MGWPTGLLIDGTNTVADAKSGAMYVKNSILSGMTANFQSTDADFQATMDAWFSGNGGRTFANNSDVSLADPFNLSNPNAMPLSGSPIVLGAGTPPNDGFFDATATYVGAFKTTDWTAGWSTFNFQVPTAVEDNITSTLPTEYELAANYPNPFNPSTTIRFALPQAGHVKLAIYNTIGQQVATLIDGNKEAGFHSLVWEAHNMPSGIYFYSLQANGETFIHKMTLIK
jgi:hypothetical protein